MKKQLSLGLFLVFFLLAPAFKSMAQKTATPAAQSSGTWQSLATLHAGRMGEHDVLDIAGPHSHFKQLKLKVTDAPLNIKKIVVNYDNGEMESFTTRYEIPKNGTSNIIELKQGDYKLKSIEMWYDTKGLLKGKAHVTVMGLK